MPLFTIAIVTRNYGRFIASAIRSCWTSTCQDFEILVVDDGSDDDTPSIVQALMHEQPIAGQLRYLPVGRIGQAPARNESLRMASGEYLVCLDADDALMPDTLACYRDLLLEDPSIDVLYGNLVVSDPDLIAMGELHSQDVPRYPHSMRALLSNNRVTHPGSASRVRLMRQVGGYRTELDHACDYALWLDLAAHEAHFRHVDTSVATYRRHGANITAQAWQQPDWDLPVLRSTIERYRERELLPSLEWEADEARAQLAAICFMCIRLLNANADRDFVQAYLEDRLRIRSA